MVKYDYGLFCRALAGRDGPVCRVRLILAKRRAAVPSGLLTCDGVLDGHHLVPKQRICGAWESTAYATGDDRILHPAALRTNALTTLLEDPRNGMLACRRHHDLLERKLVRLFRDDLPDGCVEFAEDLGLGWSIERDYVVSPAGDPTPARCRSPRCGAALVWGITAKGKRMPLNAEPVTVDFAVSTDWKGIFAFVEEDSDVIASAGPLEPGRDLFLTHYATCPDAPGFRR